MPHKGKKAAGGARGSKEHGDKKTAGATKPTDKKTPESAEKKQGTTSASTSASAASAAASAGSSKVPATQERTMKPSDPKEKPSPKPEAPKSTQTTKPTTTTTTTTTAAARTTATTSSSATTKPSTEKSPRKQDAKKADVVKPKDTAVSSSGGGRAAATAVGAAAVGAAAVGAATAASSSKPKKEVKEEKKVSVDKIAAASAPSKSEQDDALDLLIDTLGGPESVPESPKFTGPEISDSPATSEYIEELGKRESTIPPEYRHLLDGKGEKPSEPPPKPAEENLGDDDLIAAMSSEFVSSPAPPQEKRPKLEEKKEAQKASTAPTAPSQSQPASVSDEALDALMGTLEGPPATVPESPQYTGPEVTENITSTYLEELGKRESTIPPKYRHLLDGKDHGKPIPPPAEKVEPAMSDSDVLDELSKDFECSLSPAAQPCAPPAAVTPKDTKQDKQVKADVVVPSSASSVQASAQAPTGPSEDALDELMGTLEGPEFFAPESPAYTGPEVTETATKTYIEELGKKESTIPPAYRHLLDGKEGGKPAPPPPEEKPLTESELEDAFDKDFACSLSPAVQQTPAAKPKDAEVKKTEPEAVVSASSSSSVQAATPSKAPTCKADPLDALAGTLGTRQEDPKYKKPVADKVKEKTGKESKEKLGEDEETIPPDYRLKEVKDKDGKPLLPKPEEKPQAMSEDDLLDALSEGFVTSPVASKCPPMKPPETSCKKSGSEEVISCSKVSSVQSSAPKPSSVQSSAPKPSSVQSSAPKPSSVQSSAPKPLSAESKAKQSSETEPEIPDDALDLLSGSLGTRKEDPDENKPVVDVVKEKATKEHIDRLGDRDDTIPPEYRHLLDGKEQGKPAKPEEVKPRTPLSDDAAIDALSSGFSTCDAGSADKAKCSSKDKTEKSTSSTPVSQTAGKTVEAAKDKTGKSTSSTPVSQAAGKTQEASKPASQSSSTKPSASKPYRS